MKNRIYLITLFICLSIINLKAQNSPLFIYGSGLDGSTYQKAAIYSDQSNGLLIEAPLDATNNKLPIEFNWRGNHTTPLFINAEGKVGINSKTTFQTFSVNGSIGFSNQPSSDKKLFSPEDGLLEWMTHDFAGNHGFTISSQGDRRVYLNTNGDSWFTGGAVGIGTVTPSQKFSVSDGNISVDTYGNWIGVASPGSNGKTFARLLGTDIANAVDMAALTTNGYVRTVDNQLIQDNSSLSTWALSLDATNDAFYVKRAPAGNSGGSGFSRLLTINKIGSGNAGVTYLKISAIDDTRYESAIRARFIEGNGSCLELGNFGGDVNSFNSTISVMPSGRVGIGVTNPEAALHVDGRVLSNELKVTALNAKDVNVEGYVETTTLKINGDVPTSDYVFEPDYDLRSLEEVETFVKENKHLPEVPSAAEFKENGYSVGQMDDILLRKVEELTLYIIELKKEVQTLKNEKEK